MQQQKSQELEIIDIYFILEPVFYFSRFCGLWIHSLKRQSPAISIWSFIYFCGLLSLFGYLFYLNLDKEFWIEIFGKVYGSQLQSYGLWSQVLSGISIAIISLVMSLITHKKQWLFLERLDLVDKVLNDQFGVLTPKRITKTVMFILEISINVVIVLFSIFAYFVLTWMGVPALLICVSFPAYTFPYFGIIMQFCFGLHAITKRFYYINNIFRQLTYNDIPKVFDLCTRNEKNERQTPTISIQEIYSIYGGYQMRKDITGSKAKEAMNKEIRQLTMQLKQQNDGIIQQFKRRNLIEVVEYKIAKLMNDNNLESTIEHLTKLVDLHDDLLDCISFLNQTFSFQILLIVSQIFGFSVLTYYYFYRAAYIEQSNIILLTSAFWTGLYNVILYIIILFADNCTHEGKFTGTAVHKVINKLSSYKGVDARIIQKLSVISHQLTMRTPDVTCGLYSFNWELIFTIISAVSIYLIFLVQFEETNFQNRTLKNYT